MVLSNAERQARYRKNLKARALGVSPDDVLAAVEAMVSFERRTNPDAPEWEEILKRSRARGGLAIWRQWFAEPFDPELCDDLTAAGLDGDIVRRVWPVAHAVLNPPQG
ncbi:hypothetical protein [Sphingopyxis sp. GC21]|uniref:hypothetical protein n=1 Tax=Sphingopyxis sp. GC21 TaxID=2933562 RepID=UPI0021E4413E|nr:hypothetical protein [Sphingopyxis sp. GC21]